MKRITCHSKWAKEKKEENGDNMDRKKMFSGSIYIYIVIGWSGH